MKGKIMKRLINIFSLFFCAVFCMCVKEVAATSINERPRVLVLTDIANEPDDEESLVRFLVYSSEYDVEGIVATTSCWLKNGPREDRIRRQLDAYEKVYPTLCKHADGYPTVEQLRKVTCTGQTGYGLADTDEGKSTDGSRLILSALQKVDSRPLWIALWGGSNTLAQALMDARKELSPDEFNKIVKKLRVYSIADQDDSGAWLRREFPELFYIVDPSQQDNQLYYRSVWCGFSGDRYNDNGGYYHFDMVDNPWLEENIINNHGALGECYPRLAYLMEGDTPSFIGLINNGLGWSESPSYGGWGGRYMLYKAYGETRPIWTSTADSRDAVILQDGTRHVSNQATIFRWREHFQNDFAARMDWCVADSYDKANHNPVAVLNGDKTKKVLHIEAGDSERVLLSAEGTSDPDGDNIDIRWWIYTEAGTIRDAILSAEKGNSIYVDLSKVKNKGTLHVIMEVKDEGSPSLYAYRRAIIYKE